MVLFCYKLSQNGVGTSRQDEYLKKRDNTIDSLIIMEKYHIDKINSLKDELKHSEDVIDLDHVIEPLDVFISCILKSLL